ncbi:MAG TPA: acetyl-CoA acetyltransferase [Solirubrobacteraceae bacterium]|nr:acetyl-CoA acetyltransferase [Solirubrobacteraceae bacterium]
MTAAVAGIGESDSWDVADSGLSALDLIGQATAAALGDSGLRLDEVDGLFTASAYYGMPGLNVGEYLGVRPRYSDSTSLGGASFVSHLQHAAVAIETGLCDVALIAYGSTQRADGGRLKSVAESFDVEAPYRPRYPISQFALAAARHMHEFGTTRKQLAEVAVAAREWARPNDRAFARDPLTIDDVLSSRMISTPLTSRDACLVTDGAGALLVTSAERAASLRQPPALLLGGGEAHWHRNISQMPDLVRTAASESGRRAYERAGVRPEEVDAVELYDAFTICTILFLEDLGFCPKGEGGAFVSGGRIAPGGELPVNTNGGGLSYCHPGMYGIFLLAEAVRRIRGGDDVVLAHGNGAVLSAQSTVILGSAATGA